MSLTHKASNMIVKIKLLNERAVVPSYAHNTDAGLDLVATSRIYDKDGNIAYGTGVAVEIPEGYVGLVFPRSSISKKDLALSNSVGVIDSGYRGEIFVKFKPTLTVLADSVSLTPAPRHYEIGERVAQLIILPYPHIDFSVVDDLSSSERGAGGYGSTGK